MKSFRPHAVALALAAAFPSLALAQSNDELLKELRELKDRVTQLESALKAKEPGKPAEGDKQWGMTPAQIQDFNRVNVKTEALEDAIEAQGLKGLKISGVIDPAYIYNMRQRTSSFAFLNNFSGDESFAYDNSYFGMAVIDFQKELEGGTRWRLTLAPHKSVGSNYNFPSIVHEASVSIPLGDLQTRVWAGQIPDWSGYEYYLANQTKFVTHGMMFDFLAPTFYTGLGTDIVSGKWQIKTAIANMNAARYNIGDDGNRLRSPVFSTRVDYAKGEFNGWGTAWQLGRTTNNVAGGYSGLINGEVDGYFIRGDLTLQGQLNYGQQKNAAFNGGDSRWYGLSALGAYKITPRFEIAARLDYINNKKNGGGTFNLAFPCDGAGVCGPDGRNGFGPGMVLDEASGTWIVGDPDTGANRYAFSLATNYTLTTNATLKFEYRYDRANLPVFISLPEGNYKKDNHLFGGSVVVSF
jgi:Protein of unknown function (DUF3138)